MDIDEEVIRCYFQQNDERIHGVVDALQKLDFAISHLSERVNELSKQFIELKKEYEHE